MNRILVVDDEKSIRFALNCFFKQRGLVVDCANDIESARDLLLENHYSIVILDWQLGPSGDCGGLDLALAVRQRWPDAVIVMISAVESPDCRRRTQEAGADVFLAKPVRLAAVADVAFGLLAERATRTDARA